MVIGPKCGFYVKLFSRQETAIKMLFEHTCSHIENTGIKYQVKDEKISRKKNKRINKFHL